MTDEEKAKMEDILMRHLEEDGRLCPIAEAVPGDYVAVVLPCKFLFLIPWNVALDATVIERDLSRPDDGVKIRLLHGETKTLQLPLDHPCIVTPGVED